MRPQLVLVLSLALLASCDAGPSEAPAAPASAPAETPEIRVGGNEAHTGDPLADEFFRVIRDLVELRAADEDRDRLVERVVAVVEELEIGPADRRLAAVRSAVDEIMVQAQRYRPRDGRAGEVSGQQKLFVVSRAQITADRVRASLEPPAGSAGDAGYHLEHTLQPLAAPSLEGVEIPEGHVAVSWRLIGGFTWRDGMELPEEVVALDGEKVVAAGYMLSLGEFEDIREFLLVESAWACCFGMTPDVNQVIVVRIPPEDRGIDLVTTPIAVSGRFQVKEERDDGYVVSLYALGAEEVFELD